MWLEEKLVQNDGVVPCSFGANGHGVVLQGLIRVGDSHQGPLITRKKLFLQKIINVNERVTDLKNTRHVVAAQFGKAHDSKKP
jgi:hypothetical protein